MIGVVFCGGKSTRMGTDKGLIPFLHENWASLAFGKLNALSIPVMVSINSAQEKDYLSFFSKEKLLTDNLSLGVAGPLLGLLSAHVLHPTETILVLACDLPLMRADLLSLMQSAYEKVPEADAVVYHNKGHLEPLCAIYRAKGLIKIMNKLKAEKLARYSMKYVLSLLNVYQLDIPEGEEKAFTNFNTQGIT